jgi:hypothetical protein
MHMVPVATSSGYRYWVTFIDDWLRYGWIYLLKRKSDVFKAFKVFKAFVELQFSVLIKCLHNDKGSEYIGRLWDAFFAQTGIRREHTVEGMSQQGGIAERCNRTLEEHVIAMLNGARLPIRFWGKALYTYGRLLNMMPLSAIPPDTMPYEMAHKRKPNYSTLRVFGCCTWAHIRRKKQRSLEPYAKPCVFLGVPDNFKGWKLWDPSAQGGRGGVIISCDVIWNEEEFPGLSKDAHDPIPAHFGCIDAKTPTAAKPSMPASKESAEDSDEQEGGTLPLPALVLLDDNPAEEPPSPTSSSLSSDALPPPPPALRMPPRPATAPRMPDTPQPPQRQSAPRLARQRIPELLLPLETLPAPSCRSGRSTAGVPPNPRLSATLSPRRHPLLRRRRTLPLLGPHKPPMRLTTSLTSSCPLPLIWHNAGWASALCSRKAWRRSMATLTSSSLTTKHSSTRLWPAQMLASPNCSGKPCGVQTRTCGTRPL